MIRINLLPSDGGNARASAARRPASAASPAPFYLLLALLYAGALAAGYYVYSIGAEAQQRVAAVTKKRDDLKAEVQRRQAEFEANNLRSQEIEERYAVVEALGPQNRIFWSEKLNMIAMARLNLAVYVTKIELQEQIDERETQESLRRREEWKAAKEKDPKLATPEPAPVKQPVINQTLLISGVVYGNESSQRLSQIRMFMEKLRSFEWTRETGEKARFLDRMDTEIDDTGQKIDTVAGVEVLRFTFKVKAQPQLDRTNAEGSNEEVAADGDKKTGGVSTVKQHVADVEGTK